MRGGASGERGGWGLLWRDGDHICDALVLTPSHPPPSHTSLPGQFAFFDYSVNELIQIAKLMIGAAGFKLRDEASKKALCKMVESIPCEAHSQ